MTTNVSFVVLNGFNLGSSASQRVGMKITMRSLEIRCGIITSGTQIAQMTRIIVILDRQANGVFPSGADVLAPATYLGVRNLANRKRFKCLMDKVIVSSDVDNFPSRCYRHWYIKFRKPVITDYNTGNAGDITDIASNSLLMVLVSDNAANNPNTAFTVRMRFTDQ